MCNSFPPRSQLTGVIAEVAPDHRGEGEGAKDTLRELAQPITRHKQKMCQGLIWEHKNTNETLMQTNKNSTLMQTRWGQPQRECSVSRVVRAPADIDRPPSSNKFLRSRVTHNCVQYSLPKGVGGYSHAASCAIGSKGIKCVTYRIVHKSTASQHVIVEPRKVKHKETQGRPRRYLYTKLALENL